MRNAVGDRYERTAASCAKEALALSVRGVVLVAEHCPELVFSEGGDLSSYPHVSRILRPIYEQWSDAIRRGTYAHIMAQRLNSRAPRAPFEKRPEFGELIDRCVAELPVGFKARFIAAGGAGADRLFPLFTRLGAIKEG